MENTCNQALPTGLSDAGDFSPVSQCPETNPANLEFPVIPSSSPTELATVVLPRGILGCPLLLDTPGRFCHRVIS